MAATWRACGRPCAATYCSQVVTTIATYRLIRGGFFEDDLLGTHVDRTDLQETGLHDAFHVRVNADHISHKRFHLKDGNSTRQQQKNINKYTMTTSQHWGIGVEPNDAPDEDDGEGNDGLIGVSPPGFIARR